MRLANLVVLVAVSIALTMYGLDCVGAFAPEQAMACCNNMMCHRQHSQEPQDTEDCCQTMSQAHGALGPPSSVQGVHFSPLVLGVAPTSADSQILEFSATVVAGHSHDPPLSNSTPVPPLRI